MADFGDQSDTLDSNQAIKAVYDKSKIALRTIAFNSLVPEDYDRIDLSYITTGNGTGEIGVVSYLKDSFIVAMLSLSYDSQDRIIKVESI